MTDGLAFDVFLSHSSRDKPAVEALALRLEDEAHLTPWLDKWHLVPGEPWQEALEQALDASRTCAVFIGPSSLGPWENEEMRSALQTRVSQTGFRVVPVLLPGATMPDRGLLPRFLSRLTWVDFRVPDGVHDAEAFQRLVAGIRGVAPGHRGRTMSPGLMAMDAPYRGLEVFDEAHATLFFGREAMTQHLVETLRPRRFLAVLGPSGSGKSSLVRAGLLPTLRAGGLPGSKDWVYLLFKPGAHPLQELALELGRVQPSVDVLENTRRLLTSLEADERTLHLYVRLALASRPRDVRCCLVVDQFEEVFTLCQERTERVQFIENLRYAATIADGRTVILLTMRLDFMPQAAQYTELADILSSHQFLVGPMDEVELRRVIEEPAHLVGLRLEEGLVDTILNDVGREPGVLPLLEHALLQVWERQSVDNLMTLQGYRESGGVQGALAQRAETMFDGFTPDQQAVTRRLMLRLTSPGEGTEDTRRRAALDELWTRREEQGSVEHVVAELAAARLLTTSMDASRERQVDVAHEALIRGWPRLRGWINEDRAALRTHRRITESAQEWLRTQRDEGVLFRGARLAQAHEWREQHHADLNDLEREFLDASDARQVREAEAEQARQRRELAQAQALAAAQQQRAEEQARATKRLRRRAVWLAVVALVAIVAAGWAWRQQQAAYTQAAESNRLRYISIAQGLAAQAVRHQAERTDDRGPLLARQAFLFNERHQGRILDQVDDALRTVLSAPYVSHILRHEGWVRSVAFSPDGTRLASGGDRGTVRLWDLHRLEAEPAVLQGISVAFSPDGTRLASGTGDGTVRLWDLRRPEAEPAVLQGHERVVLSVAFSPDGTRLAAGSLDGTIRVWIVRTETLREMVCGKVSRNLTRAEWRRFVAVDLPYERTCPDLPPDESEPQPAFAPPPPPLPAPEMPARPSP